MWMSFQSTTSGLVVGTIMDNVKRKKVRIEVKMKNKPQEHKQMALNQRG